MYSLYRKNSVQAVQEKHLYTMPCNRAFRQSFCTAGMYRLPATWHVVQTCCTCSSLQSCCSGTSVQGVCTGHLYRRSVQGRDFLYRLPCTNTPVQLRRTAYCTGTLYRHIVQAVCTTKKCHSTYNIIVKCKPKVLVPLVHRDHDEKVVQIRVYNAYL